MKPSKFVAFVALFSFLFIVPVPSNAAGFNLKINDAASEAAFQNSVASIPISAEADYGGCFGRLLEVLLGIGAVILFFVGIGTIGIWLPLLIIFGIIFAIGRYIITGNK